MPDYTWTRRRLLATGLTTAAVISAGCLSESSTDSESQRSLRLDLFDQSGPLRDNHVVDLSETRSERDKEAFEATLDGSEYTIQYQKPFFSSPDDPTYTRQDGTYYQLGSVIVDEVAETHPVLRLYEPDGDTNDSPDEEIATEQLPEGDQRAVKIAHMAARARGNEGGVPWGLVQRGGFVYRNESMIENSQLLSEDELSHVRFQETTYSVEITREEFHEPVHRATVEPVASDPDRMEAILRARFVDARTDRDNLSTEARDIVREARGDGYSEPHPYSSGYREVLKAFHKRAFLDGNIAKDAHTQDLESGIVMLDTEYYDYRLRFLSGTS